MKKNINIIIIIGAIALVLIIFGVVVSNNKNATPANQSVTALEIKQGKISAKEAQNYLKNLTEIVLRKGTANDLFKYVKSTNLLEADIMTGPDMYLRKVPDTETIGKTDLNNYMDASKKLTDKLEKTIIKNSSFTIQGVIENDTDYTVPITYKTFYYKTYIDDLIQVENELLTKAGYDLAKGGKFTETSKFALDCYKAKVKAQQLLDATLDNYINKDEKRVASVSLKNKKIVNNDEELLSYLMNLEGYAYDKEDYLNDQTKLQTFLKNITKSNALEL